jgi:hypothetical protein
MIQVNNQTINSNNISNWIENGNTITSQNDILSVIQSDIFQLDVSTDPNDFFIIFDIDGNIPQSSILSIDIIIQTIGIFNWKIKKRNSNSNNTRAYSFHKLRLKKVWFNNILRNVSLQITFQNTQQNKGNANLSLSNIRIEPFATMSTNDVLIDTVSLASNRNGTGTSGPNGPR